MRHAKSWKMPTCTRTPRLHRDGTSKAAEGCGAGLRPQPHVLHVLHVMIGAPDNRSNHNFDAPFFNTQTAGSHSLPCSAMPALPCGSASAHPGNRPTAIRTVRSRAGVFRRPGQHSKRGLGHHQVENRQEGHQRGNAERGPAAQVTGVAIGKRRAGLGGLRRDVAESDLQPYDRKPT